LLKLNVGLLGEIIGCYNVQIKLVAFLQKKLFRY